MIKNYSVLIFLILVCFSRSFAQEKPPIPIQVEVRNAQGLNFGSFTVGHAGGTVVLNYDGERIGNSDVQLLNFGASSHSAIFDVFANPGTLIQIQQPQVIQLAGPSGSHVTLNIDPFQDISTGQTFITTTNPHPVMVGGRLNIPNGSSGPAGNYSGTFTLTFIHE